MTRVVVQVERLVGGVLVARVVEGAPHEEAMGSSAERVLARLGRALDRAPDASSTDGVSRRPAPIGDRDVTPANMPIAIDAEGRFHCTTLDVDTTRDDCGDRWQRANEPAPSDPAALPRWTIARVRDARCTGCPIGAAHAAQERAA